MNEFDDDNGLKNEYYDNDGIVETVIPEKEVFTPARDYNILGIAMIVFYGLWNGLVLLFSYNIIKKDYFHFTVAQAALLSLALEVAAFLPFVFILKKIKFEPLPRSEEKYGFGTYLKNVCIVFSLSVIGSMIGNIINSLIKSAGGTESKSGLVDMISGDYYIMLIFTVSFAPIFEEIMMRRMIVDRTYKYGKLKAILTSGLLFGLVHGNFEQFFYAFLVGMFFAYVYIKTGRLRHSIILHMTLNLYSMVIMFLYSRAAEAAGVGSLSQILGTNEGEIIKTLTENSDALMYLTIALIMALAEHVMAFIGVIYLLTHLNMFSLEDENQKRFPVFKTVLSPGMIICYIALAAFIILPAVL